MLEQCIRSYKRNLKHTDIGTSLLAFHDFCQKVANKQFTTKYYDHNACQGNYFLNIFSAASHYDSINKCLKRPLKPWKHLLIYWTDGRINGMMVHCTYHSFCTSVKILLQMWHVKHGFDKQCWWRSCYIFSGHWSLS